MILRAAVLGDDVDLRAALQTVFRRVRAHLHVHFGDRVDDGRAAQCTAAAAVTAVDAVDVDRLPLAALQTRHRRVEAAADRFVVVGQQLHARKNLQQRHRVAAANRQVLDLTDVEHRLVRRLRRRDDFADGTDGHCFGERSDFEPKRRHRKAVVGQHLVVADLDRPEAAELGANGVRTGLQCGEREEAHFIADGAPHFLRLLVGHDDVCARNDLILCVDDAA